ncbi:leucyl/phenylalanyl-tRNA--protein transferase [Bryobacter aggregatus]|uniref:leucyl/phenylalanyl-tRNA--protein transferase n=1 Tax=Bryobacter aggregatus TaxID=360054 RepID=UPI00192E341B|nr:leucyl/phenylalanyl-tRNA--protein transferase [Bryobacter aggregatus]
MDVIRVTDRLDPHEVLEGYRKGVFPMGYLDAPVISWHLPEHRGILPIGQFHTSRSLAHTLKRARFTVTFDTAFEQVMRACAARGEGRPKDTWITERIIAVYADLHRKGHAHSVEVWVDGKLAGGTYGIHLGSAFFAESKFHTVRDMSKVALACLVQHLQAKGFTLLDVQYWTEHLSQFGVIEVSRNQYYGQLREALRLNCQF